MTRFLLSHNHDIPDSVAPALVRDAFAQVFVLGAPVDEAWQVDVIQHPHWQCAIETTMDPNAVGQALVDALVAYRQQQGRSPKDYSILALGGRKTSPATSADPQALQPGQWGVDVVETADAEAFLTGINWTALASARPADGVFSVISA